MLENPTEIRFVKMKFVYCIRTVLPSLFYGGVSAVVIMICNKLFINSISSHFLVCATDAIIVFLVYVALFVTTRNKLLTSEMNAIVDTMLGTILKKIKKVKV